LPLSRPTIIAHDQYGRVIGQISIDLAPTDSSKDITFTSPTSNIAWVEITAPSNSEPVLVKSVRYANTTGKVPGELLTATDSNGDYSFTDLAPGNYSVQEILLTHGNQFLPASRSIVPSQRMFKALLRQVHGISQRAAGQILATRARTAFILASMPPANTPQIRTELLLLR